MSKPPNQSDDKPVTSRAELREWVKHVSTKPGVYMMYEADNTLLYVGKAKNLRNRLGSYFSGKPASTKVEAMVSRIHHVDQHVTRNEVEALVLEQNLIKEHKPYYNVLLRDDKSYPYLMLSKHRHPRFALHRGARGKGEFYGPYPSASAVRSILNQVQKVIPVRQCEDSYYANRARPCLQYQIQRCSAPCVGLISEEDYANDVKQLRLLVQGKSDVLHNELQARMHAAAQALDFEEAARYRDRISALGQLLHDQHVESGSADVDVIAIAQHGVETAISVVFVRGGRIVGQRHWYPRNPLEKSPGEQLFEFIVQIYARRPAPSELIVSEEVEDVDVLEAYLFEHAKHKVRVVHAVRSGRRALLDNARINAQNALEQRRLESASRRERSQSLATMLELEAIPRRLECFDISHISGTRTVASNVCFIDAMPHKNSYRRYNIDGITPGDDYAAMAQVIRRRFTPKEDGVERELPDLLIIDGGKGQLSAVIEILDELDLSNAFTIIAVAKGPTRKLGFETIIVHGRGEVSAKDNYPQGLALIQHIRDESHRFAIAGHRAKRSKAIKESTLEGISGLGRMRRRALLQYFGGLTELREASAEEIARVDGISKTLAQRIYETFHHTA